MENNKRKYIFPQIVCIKLDQQISLNMESVPPSGPDEVHLLLKQKNDNPYNV